MSDQRILSLVAFGLLIAGFLLPWPIAAMGRDEHAMIFTGGSLVLAASFAVISRRESFSRVVLTTIGGLSGLFVAGLIVLLAIQYWRNSEQVDVAQLLKQQTIEKERQALEEAQRKKDPAAAPIPKRVELSELQGDWSLRMKSAGENDTDAVASIKDNRVSVNPKDDGTAEMRFVLHLDSEGTPQPIDLEYVFGATELLHLQETVNHNDDVNSTVLDAYPLRDGKPCALGIIERTEKGFRICMKHLRVAGRPGAFEIGETSGIWELIPVSR